MYIKIHIYECTQYKPLRDIGVLKYTFFKFIQFYK